MPLSPELRAAFAEDGFVLLRRAVPSRAVLRARAAIARSLDADASHGAMSRMLATTFCPELVSDPAILALEEAPRHVLCALFGLPSLPPASRAQIALRFPDRRPSGDATCGRHLDGFSGPENAVGRGTLARATALVGVYLSSVPGPDRGNFVAWPGSHRAIARHLAAIDAPRVVREAGPEALLPGLRALELGAPRMLDVEPGDAIVAHHLLAHGAADNLSLRTREAIYFRRRHPDDRPDDVSPMLDERRFFAGVWP